MNYIIAYLAVIVPLGLLDALWILVLGKGFYAKHMGFLFTSPVNYAPIAFFYPIYALVVLVLVVMPAVSAGSFVQALGYGALLGLAAYGAYDLTNHATIANWPVVMTVVDMAWGMVVTALTSVIAYFLISSLR